jgi:Glycosyl hydrolases family 16
MTPISRSSSMRRFRTALIATSALAALLLTATFGAVTPAAAVTASASSQAGKKPTHRSLRACLRQQRRATARRKALARRRAAARRKASGHSSAWAPKPVHHKAKSRRAKSRRAKSRSCLGTVKKTRRPGAAGKPPSASSPAVSGAGANPSQAVMPTGNLPGWRQVLADDFSGSSLNPAKWYPYTASEPGGDPGGWFEASHVTVSGGNLVISAYRDPLAGGLWTTGGVSSAPGLVQTYGKYLVRFRFAAGHGIAHGVMLLPASGAWPPEIDFSEDNGGDRNIDTATLHYGAQNAMEHATVATDLTQWHTLGLEWTQGQLVYTLDGHEWGRMTGASVPSIPMVLDIQTQAWACGTSSWEGCPDASTPATVNLYVDWAVAYAPSG